MLVVILFSLNIVHQLLIQFNMILMVHVSPMVFVHYYKLVYHLLKILLHMEVVLHFMFQQRKQLIVNLHLLNFLLHMKKNIFHFHSILMLNYPINNVVFLNVLILHYISLFTLLILKHVLIHFYQLVQVKFFYKEQINLYKNLMFLFEQVVLKLMVYSVVVLVNDLFDREHLFKFLLFRNKVYKLVIF
jgi:hypothetical protein